MCQVATRDHAIQEEGSFWRTEDPGVDYTNPERPRLTAGGMWPTQRRLWESEAFVKVLVGGFGSGKTMLLCKRMISLALENAPVPVATISPAYTMAAKTVIPMIDMLLSGKQAIIGPRFRWRYVGSPIPFFRIEYKGRVATIWCLSSDNTMSLRGPNLGAVGIDEPFIQPKEVYTEAMSRVRHPLAPQLEIVIAGTPEQLNWGYDLCRGKLGADMDIDVLQMSTRENRVLGPGFIRRLEASMTERMIQAYIDGMFINMSEGQVYYAFDPLEHVVELPLPESAILGVGMDFNVNPMSAVLFWRAGNHMHVFGELELPNADTEAMAIELKRMHPNLVECYPDPSGKARKTSAAGQTDFTILERYGFSIHAPPAAPAIRDRENTVNGKMKPKTGRISFSVSPKCENLVKYLSVYTHKLKHKQKEMSHLLDALGYPIHRLYPLARSSVRQVRF